MNNRDVVMNSLKQFELPRLTFVLVLKSKRKRKWKCKEMIFFPFLGFTSHQVLLDLSYTE